MNIRHMLLCRPSHFRVEYVINPWMKVGAVDLAKAQVQWEALAEAYRAAGIQVSVIDQEPDVPDMVFAADQAIWLEPKTFLLSNFRYPERQKETHYYQHWFLEQGYKLKLIEDPTLTFEGNGDCLFWKKDTYFMGMGYRNSSQSDQKLHALTGKTFLPLQLVNQKFYHLDTCLSVLDEQTALCYPPALTVEGINLLRAVFPRLIEIPEVEALNFAVNSVAHRDRVFIQRGNPWTKQKLKELGWIPQELDVSEFMKSGGGIHCLGQILDWTD